jgi:NAD-dependent SIR2 family protein deacetylase
MLLHGSLFDIKCSNCDYVKHDDFTDPIVPALAIPNDPVAARETLAKAARQQSVDKANLAMHISQKSAQINKTQSPTIPNEPLSTATQPESDSNSSPLPTHPLVKGLDISSIEIPLTTIPPSSLPQCPKCTSLLRPGVVWFGESLPESVLSQVDNYFFPPTSHSTAFNLTSPSSVSDNDGEKIDLMLVIGTSSKVYPAAGYTNLARQRGARVAVVNLDVEDLMVNGRGRGEMGKGDWVFQGDAAELVPQMFEEIVGKVGEYED